MDRKIVLSSALHERAVPTNDRTVVGIARNNGNGLVALRLQIICRDLAVLLVVGFYVVTRIGKRTASHEPHAGQLAQLSQALGRRLHALNDDTVELSIG